MGSILILTAIIWGTLFRTRKPALGFLLLPTLLIFRTYNLSFKPPLAADTYYYKESDYYTIKVKKALSKDGKIRLDALVLDNLVHSCPHFHEGKLQQESRTIASGFPFARE